VLLFPLFLVRLILCLLGLLLVWIFMQLLLVGAPTKDPFEPWRENWIRGTVRTAGKMMIIASASPGSLKSSNVRPDDHPARLASTASGCFAVQALAPFPGLGAGSMSRMARPHMRL